MAVKVEFRRAGHGGGAYRQSCKQRAQVTTSEHHGQSPRQSTGALGGQRPHDGLRVSWTLGPDDRLRGPATIPAPEGSAHAVLSPSQQPDRGVCAMGRRGTTSGMARRGFTLIELLVAIAILAILAGILLPVFTKARERGRAAVCLAHLKQFGVAVMAYADDWDEKYPHAVDWADRHYPHIWDDQPQFRDQIASMPYLPELLTDYGVDRRLWACPADRGVTVDQISHQAAYVDHAFTAWGMSYGYRTELAFRQVRLSSLPDPSRTNLLADIDGAWHFGTTDEYGTYRYQICFADGHAKSVTLAEARASWDVPVQ